MNIDYKGKIMNVLPQIFQLDKDKEYSVVVKEITRHRSLNANAYYWKLVGEIASLDCESTEAIHKEMLRKYGKCELIKMKSSIDASRFFEYYDIYKCYEEYSFYKIYQPSHKYDKNEFGRLLEGTIQEAQGRGIATWDDIQLEEAMKRYE